MKYLPLVWAGLRRRPVHPILTATAMAFATCLAGLVLGMARVLPPSGELDLAVRAIAGIGFLLILLLTAHAAAQALRERGYEFALLRVLGFSRRLVLTLFFLEVASACTAGVAIGIGLAQFLFFLICRLLLPPMMGGGFLPTAVIALDLAGAVLVALVSTLLPACRLVRLNLATALARGGAMIMLRQIIAVTLLSSRSFHERIKSSLVIIVALVCVTVPPLTIIALGLSLKASYLNTGASDRVLVLSQDARRQSDSHISPFWLQTIRTGSGIRQWHGAPLVDFEISTYFRPRKQEKPENGNARLRGIGPAGFVLRPELKVISGRLPRPGSRDMMVGVQAARKFAGLEIGDQVEIANAGWHVVGIFQTGNNLDGDAVVDADVLKTALHRGSYDVALLSLKSPSDLGRLQKSLRSLSVVSMREQDYYAGLWQIVPKVAFYVAATFLLIIGGGALAATTHSVYAAVEARAREIIILRAVGFDSVAVSISVVLETLLVACLGATIGTGIVWLWVEGYPYNGGIEGGVFPITVTWSLLLIALSWAFVVALAGASMPCRKAGRGTVVEAMREL